MRISATLVILATAASTALAGGAPKSFRLTSQPATGKLPAGNGLTDVVVDGATVWLGSGKGLSVSSNGGGSWTNYYNTDPFGTEEVSAIAIQQVGGQTGNKIIWVATAHSEQVTGDFQSNSVGVGSGLSYRYFYGADTAWHHVPQPLDSAGDKTISYGATSYSALPVIVPQQNLTYDIAITPSGNVFVASFAGGLRKSTNNGKTWQRVFLPADGIDTITPAATTPYNMELNPVKNFNHRAFSVLALDDSTIFCGTANGINKSTDGGVSWIHMTHKRIPGISGNFIVAIANQRYGSRSMLWAATVDADRTADPSEQRSLSYSADGGATWTTATPLHGMFVHNVGFLGATVYAATDSGMWCSDDWGASWTARTRFVDSIRHQRITQLSVFSVGGRIIDSTVYIGTSDGLVISKEAGGCSGTYTIEQASKDLKSGMDTHAYPSPFSPSQEVTRIKYRVADPGVVKTGSVTIQVYDNAMNPVRTVVRNAMRDNEREYVEIWDGLTDSGKQAANGVYHYSVRVDNGDRRWGKIIVMQ